MTIEEMFESLWVSYPSDLCRKKRGGKQPALSAFKKINPSEQEFNRIMQNMKAQIREDRKDKDAYRWPFVSSYLNQGRYDDYIEIKEKQIKTDIKKCSIDSCNDEVHGSGFTKCAFHLGSNDERLRQSYVRTGLDMKSPTFVEDCRKYCRERMGIMLSKTIGE